nr:DUF3800 domain-containing protein [Deinococcus aestuarii]
MYVDEVGNTQACKLPSDENARYFSLTGVIMSLDYSREGLHPQMEGLKRNYFGDHPDEPVIFHRKDLLQNNRPFQALRDADVRRAFFYELFELISQADYQVITAVVDKVALERRYGKDAWEPYHFAMEMLLERFVKFLEATPGSSGDVMVEARSSKQDKTLALEFTRMCNKGTYYCTRSKIESVLTSKEVKIKNKSANIAGLQLADLIAHPSAISIIREGTKQTYYHSYGTPIVDILNASKYRRDKSGAIKGIGRKLIK